MNPFLTPIVPETEIKGRIYRDPDMTDDHVRGMARTKRFVMGFKLSPDEQAILERDGNSPFSWEV